MLFMLRMSWLGDSSNARYRQRSPRRQVSSAKMRRQAGLAGAGGTRDQDRGAAVEALAAQHLVEARDAGRDALAADFVVEAEAGERQDREAVLVDEERILVGAVRRAAVLDDAQPARRDLVDDAVVEEDHAVGHVLLQPLARERTVALLAGDDGGDAPVLQPAEQPPQLRAQYARGCRSRRTALSIVSSTTRFAPTESIARPRRRNRPSRSNSPVSSISVRSTWMWSTATLPSATSLSRSKPSERTFSASSRAGLLEGDEHAGLAVLRRAAHQELHRQQRLAAAGAAAYKGWSSLGKTTQGDLIETLDAGGRFGKRTDLAARRALKLHLSVRSVRRSAMGVAAMLQRSPSVVCSRNRDMWRRAVRIRR